jgi:CRISPR type III-B/RAMP module RAMP protein Cmr6
MVDYQYLVPSDSGRIIKKHISDSTNFGLRLARYVPREAIYETDRIDDRGKKSGKERNFWLRDICNEFEPDRELIAATYNRWVAMTEGTARWTMQTRSRLIIGLGGKGALEFGITLHPVSGLPYIPGSALKGLCRNYALYFIANESGISLDPISVSQPSEVAKQLDEHLTKVKDHGFSVHPDYMALYRNIFGTQQEAGHCVFFDAVIRELPEDNPLFVVEVMTPHFRNYYEANGKLGTGNDNVPNDADDPNPITFIAVNSGIGFRFAIGMRHNATANLLADARKLLGDALQVLGIGSKTAAGYGVFVPIKSSRTT